MWWRSYDGAWLITTEEGKGRNIGAEALTDKSGSDPWSERGVAWRVYDAAGNWIEPNPVLRLTPLAAKEHVEPAALGAATASKGDPLMNDDRMTELEIESGMDACEMV